MNELLLTLSKAIGESLWLAPLFALLAGLLTSFLPCSLSSIPLVIGYVGAGQKDTKTALGLSLTFAAGSALTFTALGAAASLAGRLIGAAGSWWYLILGLLMVLMALQTWELFEIIPSSYLLSKNKKTGHLGAFLAGILGGVFSSPCSTPMLVALLALVAGRGSLLWGVFLLLLYALGHSFLIVVAGTSVGFVKKLSADARYGRASAALRFVMGGLILLIGFYMFYLGF